MHYSIHDYHFLSHCLRHQFPIQVANEAEQCLTLVLSQYDPFRCLSVSGTGISRCLPKIPRSLNLLGLDLSFSMYVYIVFSFSVIAGYHPFVGDWRWENSYYLHKLFNKGTYSVRRLYVGFGDSEIPPSVWK